MWEDGAEDGGTPIIGYQVSYDQGVGDWIVLATQHASKTYIQSGLAFGLYYQFKVAAKTAFSLSEESEVLSVLCAA